MQGTRVVTTWQEISDKAKELPADKQREVLDFVEFLRAREGAHKPLIDPAGLLANLDIDISENDIAEIRREMWGRFPREDI